MELAAKVTSDPEVLTSRLMPSVRSRCITVAGALRLWGHGVRATYDVAHVTVP
jgi:hypothetical protein